jgi:hypothetical protein
MKDISVPIPNFGDFDQAEIMVVHREKSVQINYRIVSFQWDVEENNPLLNDELSLSLARITRLKASIEAYDKNWELIQIYNPPENARSIQVLYRKKK